MEAINKPFEILDRLFVERGQDHHRFSTIASQHFRKVLSAGEDGLLNAIPLLTAKNFRSGVARPNTLVRFVGMVADVFEPELYAPAVESTSGKGRKSCTFRDSMPNDPDYQLVEELEQRHNFLCVPLPAENAWARAAHFQQLTANQIASASSSSSAAAAALTGSKRRRAISGAAVESGTAMDVSDNEDDEHAAQANEAGADGGADTGKRRKRDDEGRDEDAGASSAIDRSRCSSSTGMRLDGEAGSATAAAPFAEANLGLPLPHPSDEFDLSCLVRVYQPSEASAGSGLGNRRSGASFEDTSAPCGAFDPPFRLGDMVEVVGILTGDPVMPRVGRLAGAGGAGMKQQEGVVGDEEEEDEEDFELFGRPQLALPSSLVPRLHAILYRPLAPTYPLLQPTIKAEANIALAAGPRSLSSSSSSSFAATEESAAPLARTVQPFSLAEPSNPALLGLKASAGTLPLPPASSSSSPAATGAHWLQFRDDEEGASAASDSDRYLAAAAVAIQHPSTLAAAIADCRKAAINATADACFDFLFCGVSPSSSVSPPPGLPPALAAIPESLRREVLGTTAIPAGSVSSSSSFPSSGVFLGAANMRAALLATFTSALGGDALAAEYLLLHLLSSVTMRQDTLSVVGKLALNLQGFPEPLSSAGTAAAPTSASAAGASVEDAAAAEKERTSPLALGSSLAARRLHSLLGQLTPRTALLPLTISKLNNRRFAPKKDADTDRILAGVLQLGAGTHVTVDATVLQTGKLKEQGVLNLRELQGVINDQALTLHFPFHTQKLSVDIQFLLLSSGRSLVKTDIELPLSKEARQRVADEVVAGSEASAVFPLGFSEEKLLLARAYLAFARSLSYTLSSEVRDAITDDLAAMRKDDRSFGPEAMHRLLGLARLCALSHGEKELTLERWKQVRAMEDERNARLGLGQAQGQGQGGAASSSSVSASRAPSQVPTPSAPLSPSFASGSSGDAQHHHHLP